MTTIERAARAIAEALGEDPDDEDNVPGLGHKRLKRWRRYVLAAAAVLEAIRDPSEAMKQAGAEADGWSDHAMDEMLPVFAAEAWHQMIDAALEEPHHGG